MPSSFTGRVVLASALSLGATTATGASPTQKAVAAAPAAAPAKAKTAAPAESWSTRTVNHTARVHASPGAWSARVADIDPGEQVQAGRVEAGWVAVKSAGGTGWVSSAAFDPPMVKLFDARLERTVATARGLELQLTWVGRYAGDADGQALEKRIADGHEAFLQAGRLKGAR